MKLENSNSMKEMFLKLIEEEIDRVEGIRQLYLTLQAGQMAASLMENDIKRAKEVIKTDRLYDIYGSLLALQGWEA